MFTSTSLAEILAWFRSQRFTGTITLHLLHGIPREATWGPPNRATFSPPAHPRNGASRALELNSPLDTSPPSAVGSTQED